MAHICGTALFVLREKVNGATVGQEYWVFVVVPAVAKGNIHGMSKQASDFAADCRFNG